MRQTFDRLVGPVAVSRASLPGIPHGVPGAATYLVPTDLVRWHVVAGTRPTGKVRVDVAELRNTRDEVLARAVSRLGLCSSGPAVDSDRAAGLLRSVRDRVATPEHGPLRDPLVRYAPGEDPRPMWKTHVDPAMFGRDASDDIVDQVVLVLRALRASDEADECERRAARAARLWVASDGAARLYRVTMAEMRRVPVLKVTSWPLTFAHALLRSSTSAKDLRVHWHSLAMIAPHLVVLAESIGARQARTHPGVALFDRADEWRTLAAEANAWIDVLDELAMLDDELALSRRGRTTSTAGIKKTIARLHEVLQSRGIMLYHRVHDLEAEDTDGIRSALENVVSDRLGTCGIGPDTPPGALVGVDAAVLLSVQTALAGRRCIDCGQRARPGNARCTEHQRAAWRRRKARDRRAKSASPRRAPQRGEVPAR